MAQKVTTGVYKGVTTAELDELAAETAASMTATHPDYALVSRRPVVSQTVSVQPVRTSTGSCSRACRSSCTVCVCRCVTRGPQPLHACVQQVS